MVRFGRRAAVIGLLVCIAMVATAILLLTQTGIERYFGAWSDRRVEVSQQAGDEIITGLAAYFSDTGNYPESIEEILPKHLVTIHKPRAGDGKWRYRVSEDGKWFRLSFAFDDGGYPISWYDSKEAKWYVDE